MTCKSSIDFSRTNLNGNNSIELERRGMFARLARAGPGTASRPSSKGRRAYDRRRTAPETDSEKVWHRAAGPRISFEISRPLLTLA